MMTLEKPAKLSVVGIDPDACREYQWIGDPAVNREESPVAAWLSEGTGLVPIEGQQVTTFVCKPLRPTTLAIVYGHASMGAYTKATPEPVEAMSLVRRNFPAVYRAAIAYSIVEIKNGPACTRMYDAGGLRLTDDLLDWLDRKTTTVTSGADSFSLKLFDHLGPFILADSEEDAASGKA